MSAGTLVRFSNGEALHVYPVPPFVFTAIEAAHPLPDPPTPGAMVDRECLLREAAWLMALPEVRVPEAWEFPRALTYAGLAPRVGDEGRLLDYIEYELLATAEDVRAVQLAMYGGALTEAEIGTAEAAFPGDGGRATASAYPTKSE